jgi:exopolysaccharide biosynthesis predicted pyruvyltransferase EpsI
VLTHSFDSLAKSISKIQGPIYFFPNPGNWGDALIRSGTVSFFRENSIEYTELHRRNEILERKGGGTVIYGGGGAWCNLWNHSVDHVRAIGKRFNVIVLPSSYEMHYEIPRVEFFCRDKYESQRNMPNAVFCHEMAFHLESEVKKNSHGEGVGYFFRKDKESSSERRRVPIGNVDLSQSGNHLTDTSEFFGSLAKYSVIHTDRLHVAIAACLLGKSVHLYKGAYFKIKAVYLSSMQGYFDNLVFYERFEDSELFRE